VVPPFPGLHGSACRCTLSRDLHGAGIGAALRDFHTHGHGHIQPPMVFLPHLPSWAVADGASSGRSGVAAASRPGEAALPGPRRPPPRPIVQNPHLRRSCGHPRGISVYCRCPHVTAYQRVFSESVSAGHLLPLPLA
jgi:hypothetical protein